jgi:hypothetical protein
MVKAMDGRHQLAAIVQADQRRQGQSKSCKVKLVWEV